LILLDFVRGVGRFRVSVEVEFLFLFFFKIDFND